MKVPGSAAGLICLLVCLCGCTRPPESIKAPSLASTPKTQVSPTPIARTEEDERETDLRLAAREGEIKEIQALLSQGVNIDAQDEYGWTALREAVFQENISTVKFLLAHRANPNISDVRDGSTPLSWAAQTGQTQVTKALLDAGADPNVHDTHSGMTPLGGAAGMGHVEIVKLLISKGADVNARDKYGDTMLPEITSSYQSAVRSGRKEDAKSLAKVIELLLRAGAR